VVTSATAIPFLLAWYAYPLARRIAGSSAEQASDESE
jgi:hypothetical protein